jgi:hypothetical protein
MAVRLGLLLTMVLAIGGYALEPALGKGLLGGGIAGVLAFWILARRTEKLATLPREKIHSVTYAWTAGRLVFYGIVLVWAYRLDPDSLRGVLGATVGLFIIQGVVLLLGLTGLDLKTEERQDGEHR